MMADQDEFNINNWNKFLQNAILNGIESVKDFINSSGEINRTYNLGFKLINISEELLTKILKKEYKEYDRSSADFESYLINKSQGNKEVAILVQSIGEKDKYNRNTIMHYINAIFIKNLKV